MEEKELITIRFLGTRTTMNRIESLIQDIDGVEKLSSKAVTLYQIEGESDEAMQNRLRSLCAVVEKLEPDCDEITITTEFISSVLGREAPFLYKLYFHGEPITLFDEEVTNRERMAPNFKTKFRSAVLMNFLENSIEMKAMDFFFARLLREELAAEKALEFSVTLLEDEPEIAEVRIALLGW